jgi:hypothetical protein
MAFKRLRGKTKIMYFKGDTAAEVRDGSLVQLTDSATVAPLDNDSDDRIIGVARRNDTVTDSALVPVEVPVENAVEWLIDVDSTGAASDSDVGRYCSVDTAEGNSVNAGDSCTTRADVSDTAIRNIFITGVPDTSHIIGVLSNLAFTKGVGDSAVG